MQRNIWASACVSQGLRMCVLCSILEDACVRGAHSQEQHHHVLCPVWLRVDAAEPPGQQVRLCGLPADVFPLVHAVCQHARDTLSSCCRAGTLSQALSYQPGRCSEPQRAACRRLLLTVRGIFGFGAVSALTAGPAMPPAVVAYASHMSADRQLLFCSLLAAIERRPGAELHSSHLGLPAGALLSGRDQHQERPGHPATSAL